MKLRKRLSKRNGVCFRADPMSNLVSLLLAHCLDHTRCRYRARGAPRRVHAAAGCLSRIVREAAMAVGAPFPSGKREKTHGILWQDVLTR